MIGSDEMSSTSMDISETFRPEDLSKTDFFDFVTAPDIGIVGMGVNDRTPMTGGGSNETNGGSGVNSDQPLQGYDQFWGSDKDPNRLDPAIFEDLERYCWQQPTNSQHTPPNNAQIGGDSCSNQHTSLAGGLNNTDGQIYTLTVLNGTEPWLKRDPDGPIAPTLDLDTLLGSFPSYVKSEFVYEDSGFSTDNTKDELNHSSQSHPSLVPVTTVVTTNSTNLAQFQNNNNDWQMADHNNSSEQSSAESLLRSALQGKGYSKGLHIQNGIAIIPNTNTVKDEELRRVLFSSEADSLNFADSTLSAPIFDDTHGLVTSPSISLQQQHQQQLQQSTNTNNNCNSDSNNTNHSITTAGIIVDDMFLSLETAFNDDFEKLKRIASEVQQFCTGNDYPEVIMEVSAPLPNQTQTIQIQTQSQPPPPPPPPPPQPLKPEVTTSIQIPTSTVTKTKKYKRSSSNTSNSSNCSNNNNINITNNNNGGGSSSTSPNGCNGQRKERSLHYCSICAKGFKDKYSVNVHIRTHTGEKPFACPLCGKSFRQKAHLAKHHQTHQAQKNSTNIIKGSKHGQQNSRPAPTTPMQRQISTTAPLPLPPANGLLANR